ncbi:OLC1v1021128C1 [Oldenlandia corymbosa var. corymbosa]|uniref:Uncharacterized protein ycf33 n=1 Tax=Oldenlandia corymbosa var. corymbosa TaxID=529605 RepID=A0AAV1BUZ6_OLDCO|nr:OLC1v1021128C1 [Oldenlandia corymbosa var. corymbosa]
MKTIGPPIMQANPAVSFLPIRTKTPQRTHLFQQHQHSQPSRRKDFASSSSLILALSRKKPLLIPKNNLDHHNPKQQTNQITGEPCSSSSSAWVVGTAVAAMVVVVMGLDDQKAWALGPEGPMVEEFWDNMRRYALYALTVSTGALYIVFQPILELLKNPISAILILIVAGAGFYAVSQVLSAMVGVSDFSYDYAN